MRHLFVLLVLAAVAFASACNKPADDAAPSTQAAESAAAEGEAAAEAPAAEGEAAAEAPAAEGEAAPAEGEAPAAAAAGEAIDVDAAPIAAEVSSLHGAWELDTATVLAQLAADESMSEQERAFITAMMGSMQLSFTFNPDNTLAVQTSAMGQEESSAGTWAHNGTEDNRHKLSLTIVEEGEENTQQVVAHFTAADILHLRIDGEDAGPMEMMTFRRRN